MAAHENPTVKDLLKCCNTFLNLDTLRKEKLISRVLYEWTLDIEYDTPHVTIDHLRYLANDGDSGMTEQTRSELNHLIARMEQASITSIIFDNIA